KAGRAEIEAAHSVQTIEIDIGIVDTKPILTTGHGVEEDLELVEVRLEITGQEQVHRVGVERDVRLIQLRAVGEIDLPQAVVAELRLDGLGGTRGSIGRVQSPVDGDRRRAGS